jgi:hypothetical protein
MTQKKPPDGEGPQQDLIAATEQLFHSSARALALALGKLEAGETDKVAELPVALAQVRKALTLALMERQAVAKLGHETGDAGGGGVSHAALDLAAARDEIGRRLARLRNARDAGGVSGGVE